MHVHRLQTEADLAQVEQVPRHEAPLEGQDTTEQRHLALLAHAVHQGTKASSSLNSLSSSQGHRKLVCAFANPLDIDNHNKTEAGAIMEVGGTARE